MGVHTGTCGVACGVDEVCTVSRTCHGLVRTIWIAAMEYARSLLPLHLAQSAAGGVHTHRAVDCLYSSTWLRHRVLAPFQVHLLGAHHDVTGTTIWGCLSRAERLTAHDVTLIDPL